MSNEEKCKKITVLMQWSLEDLKDLSQQYWEASKEFPSEQLF